MIDEQALEDFLFRYTKPNYRDGNTPDNWFKMIKAIFKRKNERKRIIKG